MPEEMPLDEQMELNIDTKRLDRKIEVYKLRAQKQKKAAGRNTKKKREFLARRAEELKSQFGLDKN